MKRVTYGRMNYDYLNIYLCYPKFLPIIILLAGTMRFPITRLGKLDPMMGDALCWLDSVLGDDTWLVS